MYTPIAISDTLTHALSRSPTRALFQNSPLNPFLCAFNHDGAYAWMYVQVQMKRRRTVRRDWKLNRADWERGEREGGRRWARGSGKEGEGGERCE